MLRKLARCFAFSTLDRFRGAEAIFRDIYYHDSHIDEDYQRRDTKDVSKAMIKNRNAGPRTILSDKIRATLSGMASSGVIDPKEADDILKLFNPKEGLNVRQYTLEGSQPRLIYGMNSKGLYPLNPNSSMLKQILRTVYQEQRQKQGKKEEKQEKKEKKEKKDKKLDIAWSAGANKVVYIIGTPGYGKTSSFLCLKVLHDLRISHIVQHGTPSDTLFKKNCKFFYIHAKSSSIKQIMKIMLEEATEDFDSLPKKLSLFSTEDYQQSKKKSQYWESFLDAVYAVYNQKNIQVLIIADQINALYKKLNLKDRVEDIQKLQTLAKISKPIFMVSSKNNSYVNQKYDPVLYIATSEQQIRKVNMDNYLTPESRLHYAIECLLFEFEKKGISRSETVKFLEQVREIPFMTHMAVRTALDELKINSKTIMSKKLIQTIISYAKSSTDVEKLIKNILEMQKVNNSTFQMKEDMEILQKLAKVSDFYSATVMNRDVKVALEIQNGKDGKPVTIKSFTSVVARNIQEIQQQQQQQQQQKEEAVQTAQSVKDSETKKKSERFHENRNFLISLADNNFFFRGHLFENNEKSAKDCLIFSLPAQSFQRLKNQMNNLFNPQIFQNLQASNPAFAQKFKKSFPGRIFENSLCSILERDTKQRKDALRIFWTKKSIDEKILKFSIGYVFNGQIWVNEDQLTKNEILIQKNNKKTSKFHSLIEEYARKVVDQNLSGTYIRAADGGQGFDFILSSFTNGKLRLAFVDTTVAIDKISENKVRDFYSKLLKKQKFLSLVQECHQQKSVKQMYIYYIVVRAFRTPQENKLASQGESFKKNFNKLKEVYAGETIFLADYFEFISQDAVDRKNIHNVNEFLKKVKK